MLLNISVVQERLSGYVAKQLTTFFDSRVQIGRIDAGAINRIVLYDIQIDDRQNRKLLSIKKLSAKINLLALIKGEIVISTAQIFDFNADIYQVNELEESNLQFILDALKPKTSNTDNVLPPIRINTLLVRRGALSFTREDVEETPQLLNTKRLKISNLNTNISIKRFSTDSINAKVKQLEFEDHSGFKLNRLDFHFLGNRKAAKLCNLKLQLPHTQLLLDTLTTRYDFTAGHFLENLHFEGAIKPSIVSISDLSTINAQLGKITTPLHISSEFKGDAQQIELRHLTLSTLQDEITMHVKGSIYNPFDTTLIHSAISAQISHLEIKPKGWNLLLKHNSPSVLEQLGNTLFHGVIEVKDREIKMNGDLQTELGRLSAKANYNRNGSFEIDIHTPRFEVGKMAYKSSNQLGHVQLAIASKGVWKKEIKKVKVEGKIQELDYQNHLYQNISLDGIYQNGEVKGMINIDDEYGKVSVKGHANLFAKTPEFDLQIEANDVALHKLHLIERHEDAIFSGVLIANFRGNHIDNFNGEIKLHQFEMRTPQTLYHLNSMELTAQKIGEDKIISLKSDGFEAIIQGEFNYIETTKAIQQRMHDYLPSLVKQPHDVTQSTNKFSLNVSITKTDFLKHVFEFPLEVISPFELNGSYDEEAQELHLTSSPSQFNYNDISYKDCTLKLQGNHDSLYVNVQTDRLMKRNWVTLSGEAVAKQDRVKTDFTFNNWQNRQNYSGKLAFSTLFSQNERKEREIDIDIHRSSLILADSIWNMHPSKIKLCKNSLYVDNFLLNHANQHLGIKGSASDTEQDSIVVDMKDINLEYVLNLVNFHDVEFDGKITGLAYAKLKKNDFEAEAKLFVRDFTFNDGEMGGLIATVKWDKELKSVVLDALAQDRPNYSTTRVSGTITPKEGIDLHIDANRTNLYFINYFTPGIFHDFEGRATGNVRVFGEFGAINLAAKVMVEEAKMTVTATNCTYSVYRDSVIIVPDAIRFKHITIYDREGASDKSDHRAVVNGELTHKQFSDLRFGFDIQANNLLGYNQQDFGDELFCGTIYGTGSVAIHGKAGDVNIDINIRPEANTIFSYNSSTPEVISSGNFVKFGSRNILEKKEEKVTLSSIDDKEETSTLATDLRINFLLDITPEAAIRVIMDQNTGDDITLRGAGSIRAAFYNKGNFQMFGTYRVNSGLYKLSLQEIYRKEFQFKEGGTITFGGFPNKADLNLQAIHTVNSVSLNDLRSGNIFSQNNVRVNCIMNLAGKTESPRITFDFDLPTVSEAEKQMVRSIINTEEERNLQIIYLLGIGRFYASESDRTGQNAMNSILSSTLSGQLNQILSNAINNNNWRFGTHLSTGNEGWTDMDIEGLLSGSLLNNRLLINGNFGYRESRTTTTNFVGDFDIKWLLNKSGNISLKAYNETNERYFTKSSLTTQGIGLVFKKDFDNWLDLLRLKNIFNKKRTSTSL